MKTGLRLLRRNPGFAAAAILTIALGMGANTAVFSVIEAVLLRPLPFHDPDRLVMIWETHPELARLQAAAPDYADWRTSAKTVEMAAYSMQLSGKVTVIGASEPFQAQSTTASANLFQLLGVAPLAGRWITKQEDDSHQRVMLISEAVWRNRFAANPAVIGRSVRLGPDSFTIVGVVPQSVAVPSWADLWLPYSFLDFGTINERRFHPLEVIARLKPGATEVQAQAELTSIAARLSREYPATNKTIGAAVIPLDVQTTGEVRPALIAIWGAVSLTLLIACVNVANLLLARGAARARDAAIRTALGAGTLSLLRQALAESLTLSTLGGITGLLIAAAALPVLRNLATGEIPRMETVSLDARVFAFSFLVVLVCAVLFAVLPALHHSAAPLHEALRKGTGAVSRKGRAGRAFVIAEIALAITVLAGAALLIRSYERVLSGDPGFRPSNLLAIELNLPYNVNRSDEIFRTELAPKLRALPGVDNVAAANIVPMTIGRTERSRWATRFGIPGRSYQPGQFPVAQIRFITPEYFAVMGIHLKRGRLLTPADTTQPSFVINETLARQYFPGQDPTGKSLLMGVVTPQPVEVRIVGVVNDVREFGMDVEAPPTIYNAGQFSGLFLVRAGADPTQLTAAVRRVVASVNPEFAIGRARTMTDIMAASLARRRFALVLLTVFAALAATLAAVGIYGVVSYSVATRTREMGLRMALGAQRSDVLGLVLKEVTLNIVCGLGLGILGIKAASQIIDKLLYGTSSSDPLAIGASCVLFTLTAVAATWIPAHRATRVDPMTALREE